MGVVPVDKPENYGIIEMDGQKRVGSLVDKPAVGKALSNLANAGIYVFSREVFDKLRQTKASARGEWEVTDAITFLAQEGKTVLASELLKDDWFDVGRPWDLLDANNWALKRMDYTVLGNVEQGAHLIGSIFVAKSARIRSGVYIEGPVFIDEEADIGQTVLSAGEQALAKKFGWATPVK